MLLLIPGLLFAADYTFDKEENKAKPHFIGEVQHFRGDVFHLSNGKKKKVQEGTQFYKDDALVTEKRSIAKLILVDDTVLTVGPNSELKFEDFEFKNKTDRRIHSFIRGQITGHVKNKAAQGDINIKTPNAVMGIRGTQFLVNHRTVASLEISEFALLSGSVEVTDEAGKPYQLGKSDKIVIVRDPSKDHSLSELNKLSADEIKLLESEDKSFGPEFRPFMPFFDPKNATPGTGLFVYLNPDTHKTSLESSSKKMSKPAKKSSSFENLKKLNEQLKQKR